MWIIFLLLYIDLMEGESIVNRTNGAWPAYTAGKSLKTMFIEFF